MITPQHQGLRSVTSNTLQNYHPIPRYFTEPNKLNFPTPRLPGGGKAYFYRVGHGSNSSISLVTRGHPGRAALREGVQSRIPPFAEQGAEPGALPHAPPSEGHQVNPPPDGTQRAASVPLTAAARSVPPSPAPPCSVTCRGAAAGGRGASGAASPPCRRGRGQPALLLLGGAAARRRRYRNWLRLAAGPASGGREAGRGRRCGVRREGDVHSGISWPLPPPPPSPPPPPCSQAPPQPGLQPRLNVPPRAGKGLFRLILRGTGTPKHARAPTRPGSSTSGIPGWQGC